MNLLQGNIIFGSRISKRLYQLSEFLRPTEPRVNTSRWKNASRLADEFAEKYYRENWTIEENFSIPHAMKLLSLNTVYSSMVLFVPSILLLIVLGNLGLFNSDFGGLVSDVWASILLFVMLTSISIGLYLLMKSIIAEKAFNSKPNEKTIKAPLIAKPAASGFVLMIALSAAATIQVMA